jgi:hypothetical protein
LISRELIKTTIFSLSHLQDYMKTVAEQWKNLTEKGKKVKPYTEKGK